MINKYHLFWGGGVSIPSLYQALGKWLHLTISWCSGLLPRSIKSYTLELGSRQQYFKKSPLD